MNRSSNNEIGGMLVVLGGLLLVGFAVWIMKTFDVPFGIATESGIKIVVWALAVTGALFWSHHSDFNVIKFTAPFMVSMFWYSLFPVLDYNAGIRDDFPIQMNISWYGTAFWQFVIFLAINVIGYGIIYYFHRRNNYYW
ncbi:MULTISPECIES: hypothetical protein [Enterobacter]|uniref:hypothetical protein n=2 Tax=Enterobacterales TaxID=91347 RepID=UPI001574F1B3|nr:MULTISPECIES: hypothetical protein [Enterobacter]NTZ38297.1 hypothetical protein [Enterobacter sp. JMULE2]NTZ41113.1 hypothetical protein [Enterobacter sp. JMULE2]QLS77033.1 hypothetical protein HV308_20400 [Enterobacter roggenkampii]